MHEVLDKMMVIPFIKKKIFVVLCLNSYHTYSFFMLPIINSVQRKYIRHKQYQKYCQQECILERTIAKSFLVFISLFNGQDQNRRQVAVFYVQWISYSNTCIIQFRPMKSDGNLYLSFMSQSVEVQLIWKVLNGPFFIIYSFGKCYFITEQKRKQMGKIKAIH